MIMSLKCYLFAQWSAYKIINPFIWYDLSGYLDMNFGQEIYSQ